MSRSKAQKPKKARAKAAPPPRLELKAEELEEILERAESSVLSAQDREKLKAAIETLVWLTGELEKKSTSLARLRQLFGLATSEKIREILGPESEEKAKDPASPNASSDPPQEKPKGHGKNGPEAYRGAVKRRIAHPSLNAGDSCPECKDGKVYPLRPPRMLVRVTGQAPLQATVFELESFRCNLCGKVFRAPPPGDIGEKKYDETAASMIAVLKYGSGLPFYRLQRLEGQLGIPLPRATQWEIVNAAATPCELAYAELIRQAAQGQVVHNDDTTMKVLELVKENKRLAAEGKEGRTGMFTTGIVSICEDRRIALFFTGREHAGENLTQVLKQRAAQLAAPIQMCDGLSRNIPPELETVLANCLTHGRRKFVEIVDSFPEECRIMLELLGKVYKNDDDARAKNMTPDERLQFHQEHSTETMEELERWMNEQIDEKKVEPSSSLGQAMAYMLKRWDKLTLFLREAGAPLDNNLCERALKKAILHRKNALFYKTTRGARVGDIFMSLIYTAELNGANPFDYLTELQRYEEEVRRRPQNWMPWTYQATLAAALTETASRPA